MRQKLELRLACRHHLGYAFAFQGRGPAAAQKQQPEARPRARHGWLRHAKKLLPGHGKAGMHLGPFEV